MKKTYRFKKGDRPHLDSVYMIMGIIPNDAYHQDDVGDDHLGLDADNDSGESILFLKDVTIKIEVLTK